MANESKELENKPGEGSTGQEEVKPKEGEQTPNPQASGDTQAIIERLEKTNKTLAKAEHTIVELKRKLDERSGVVHSESEDIEKIVEEKVKEKLEVLGIQQAENDFAIQELKKAQEINEELTTILKAKATITNSGVGNNQDKPSQDTMPQFTQQELSVLERAAKRAGMSLQDYVRKKNITR